MSSSGFLPFGHGEHQRACQRHIAVLQKRWELSPPGNRKQIEREIEDARKAMREADDNQISW